MSEHIFKTFRFKHGLSQAQFGVWLELGVTNPQARISHYETGRLEVPTALAHQFISAAETLGDTYALEDVYPPPNAAA